MWVTENIIIPDSEIGWEFTRAAGPGGQNVNKVATAVRLRFDVWASTALSGPVKHRLRRLAGSRISTDGVLIIEARRQRTQESNRREALDRFRDLVRRAAIPPPIRRRTRPPPSAARRRVEAKCRRSKIKRLRKPPGPDA